MPSNFVWLGKNATKTYQKTRGTFEDDLSSRTQVGSKMQGVQDGSKRGRRRVPFRTPNELTTGWNASTFTVYGMVTDDLQMRKLSVWSFCAEESPELGWRHREDSMKLHRDHATAVFVVVDFLVRGKTSVILQPPCSALAGSQWFFLCFPTWKRA